MREITSTKKNRFLICFIAPILFLYGCSAPSHTISISLDPISQLNREIDTVISDSLFIPSNVSIKAISLSDGKVLYERNSQKLMHPASNMKLLTSAAALAVLDTNFKFITTLSHDGIIQDSILLGNLYLKGYGNPILNISDIDTLAKTIFNYGIRCISLNIVVDDSYFDDLRWGPGWMWDDESDPDAPHISALSVNNNCIKLIITSDTSSVQIIQEPETNYVSIINNIKLVRDSIKAPLIIKSEFKNNSNIISINGEVLTNTKLIRKVALSNPDLFFGILFKESLQKLGISVLGEVINDTTPINAIHIVQHNQSIENVINSINKESNNLASENTLKVMGAISSNPPGTTINGIYAINSFLSTLKIDTCKYAIADGSGVSRYNLLNAVIITQLLSEIYKQPRIFPFFYNSLPIAGVDGTLSDRMKTYPTLNNVHAKTGTLKGVSCLSGYLKSKDGDLIAFSIMMQNFIAPANNYRIIQDNICTILSRFSKHPLISKINNEQ